MKLLTKAVFGAAMLALTAGSASAAVVCNDDGDCWRVKEQRNYEPSLKLRVLRDDWKWEEHEKDRYGGASPVVVTATIAVASESR